MQPNCLPKWLYQCCLPTSSEWDVALHPCQHLVVSVFWILAILGGMQQHLVVLICIFLMIYDVDHHFICLFAICVSSLMRWLSRSLTSFLKWGCLFSYCWVLRVLCMFSCKQSLCVTPFANVFSQTVACLLTLLTLSVTQQKFLILILSPTHMSLEQKFDLVARWRLVSALGFPEQRGQPYCGRLLTYRTVG